MTPPPGLDLVINPADCILVMESGFNIMLMPQKENYFSTTLSIWWLCTTWNVDWWLGCIDRNSYYTNFATFITEWIKYESEIRSRNCLVLISSQFDTVTMIFNAFIVFTFFYSFQAVFMWLTFRFYCCSWCISFVYDIFVREDEHYLFIII